MSNTRPSLAGWTEVFDETHQAYYYYNPTTKESSWTHPKEQETPAEQQQSSTSTTNGNQTINTISTLSSRLSETDKKKKKAKKKSQRRFASIADQYYLVYKRVKKMEDEKPLGYDSFTIKDKFILFHLAHLTSVKSGSVRLAEMEKEIKESEMLFSCLRGDTQKFTEFVSKNPKKLSDTLNTSKLNALHLGVASGNIHIVKYIISLLQNMKSISIDQNTFNGLTSLHIACLFGLFQIANLLIEFGGADTNVTCNCVPAAPPYLQKPITYWNNIKDCSVNSFTPFLYAIFGGSLETVIMFANLSKLGVSIEQNRTGFITDALSLACILQHVKIVDLFLREDYVFNYDPNCIDEYGMTPIMFVAMSSGNAIVVSKLVRKSASIVGVNRLNGFSCLHFAMNNGNYGFIKRLCREKEGSEELALVMRTHNPKQPLNPLQYLNSPEAQNQFTPELRKKTEAILKAHGGSEKKGFSDIVKEGYLTKQGHLVKNWKKRWFILRVGELQYFKSIQKLKEATGVINLENGSLAKTYTKCCFVLYDSKNDKKFFIQATNEEEMKEWWDAIAFCISHAGGQ